MMVTILIREIAKTIAQDLLMDIVAQGGIEQLLLYVLKLVGTDTRRIQRHVMTSQMITMGAL